MPGFLDFLLGREGQFKQAPSPFDTQQQQAFPNLLQQGLQGLGTDAIEKKALTDYQKNIIPLLSERFANAGGSSGYQNALQQSGTDLLTNIAALRQGNATNLLSLGLTPYQGEHYFEPAQEGILGDLIKSAGNAGLAYLTGGLSAVPAGITGIIDLFQKRFGGGSNTAPSAYTGIQAESTAPLRGRLSRQSGLQSLGQASGINNSLFSGGRFLGEQPIAPTQPQAYNQARQPGIFNALSLLNQANQAGLSSAARGAYAERQPLQYLEALLGRG